MSTPTTGLSGDLTIEWAPSPLDPWQREAATAPAGPVFIYGAPGTGKSHTLRARVAALSAAGADPGGIVVLTRTTRTAEEFAVSLSDVLTGNQLPGGPFIGTFHAYAGSFVRRVGARALGLPSDYTLWGPDQSVIALEQLAARHRDLPKARFSHDDARRILEWHSLNRSGTDHGPIPAVHGYWHELVAEYTAEKRRQDVVDCDDLIDIFAIVLRDQSEVRDAWRQHWARHLLVDDFQDVTAAQYELMRRLSGPTGSVTVAADWNSAVLSWCGGDRFLTKRFLMDHPEAARHHLPRNHRATESLTSVASMLQDSPDWPAVEKMNQRPIRPPGEPPTLLRCDGPIAELDQKVVGTILDHYDYDDCDWSDTALLYTDPDTATRLVACLRAHNLPYRDLGRAINQEAPDLLLVRNLLALALNPLDGVALHSAAAAGLSSSQGRKLRATMGAIRAFALQYGHDQVRAARRYAYGARRSTVITRRLAFIVDTLPILHGAIAQGNINSRDILQLAYARFRENDQSNPAPHPSGDLQRLLAIADACASASANEPPVAQLFRLLDLLTASGDAMQRSSLIEDPHGTDPTITLCPIHIAQGLQWRTVFLLDCVDEQLPGPRAEGEDELLQEAQRMLYVAITRAKDFLYICSPSADDQHVRQTRSRFLAPLEPVLQVM